MGLDAQRASVGRFLPLGQALVADFAEIESGRRDMNRPQFHAALAECRRRRTTLLIARLDRRARNVAFIANLMESGVDFGAVDMPSADRLTIHILAAVAEHEREMISARTKAALAQAKARGKQLGNPRPLEALKLANAAKATEKPPPHVLDLIAGWKAQGKGLRETVRELNRLNIRTPRGCQWYVSTVRAQLPAEERT